MPNIMPYLTAASWLATVCGVAAALSAVLPQATAASPAWWRWTRRAIDVLGLNVLSARNRTP